MDQILDGVSPTLDVPVPLKGEQLLRFFDTLCPVAEQVIDVPKIILEDIPARRLCREPQLVDKLVEVPTIVYFLKQKVDIPVPGVEGDTQIIKVFSMVSSRSLVFPVEVFKVFAQDKVHLHHPHNSPVGVRGDADELGEGFSALFPVLKKCEGHPALECESASER